MLYQSLDFVIDAHFSFCGKNFAHHKGIEYVACIDKANLFSKDEKGYYKSKDGVKYYLTNIENENTIIDMILLEDGHIVYAPVLFDLKSNINKKTKLYLKSENEEIVEDVNFIQLKNYSSESIHNACASTKSVENISIVTVRAFESEDKEELMNEYVNKAQEIKDSKVIIYDIRSNGGGGDEWSRMWTYGLTGEYPEIGEYFISIENAMLRERKYGYEEIMCTSLENKIIKNDNLIVTLVDNLCGSAGESALKFARNIENTIVIGTNSFGYQLSGNSVMCYLPNSGIYTRVPTCVQMNRTGENVDGKGYAPDIWCDGKESYDAVIKMVEVYNIADAHELENYNETNIVSHEDKLNTEESNDNLLKILFVGNYVTPGNRFGNLNNALLDVYYQNDIIKDFEVSSKDSNLMVCNEDGKLKIVCQNDGEFEFVIKYNGQQYSFTVVNQNTE